MNYKCKSGESNILINNYYISNISHYYLTKIKKFLKNFEYKLIILLNFN